MTRRVLTRLEKLETVVVAAHAPRPTYTILIVQPDRPAELYDTVVPVLGGGWRSTCRPADQPGDHR